MQGQPKAAGGGSAAAPPPQLRLVSWNVGLRGLRRIADPTKGQKFGAISMEDSLTAACRCTCDSYFALSNSRLLRAHTAAKPDEHGVSRMLSYGCITRLLGELDAVRDLMHSSEGTIIRGATKPLAACATRSVAGHRLPARNEAHEGGAHPRACQPSRLGVGADSHACTAVPSPLSFPCSALSEPPARLAVLLPLHGPRRVLGRCHVRPLQPLPIRGPGRHFRWA